VCDRRLVGGAALFQERLVFSIMYSSLLNIWLFLFRRLLFNPQGGTPIVYSSLMNIR
jgi:hypothetical protein